MLLVYAGSAGDLIYHQATGKKIAAVAMKVITMILRRSVHQWHIRQTKFCKVDTSNIKTFETFHILFLAEEDQTR